MMNKKTALIALLMLPLLAVAQMPLAVSRQDNVKLPWGLYNLTICDGRLVGNSGGVMLAGQIRDNAIYHLQPDTLATTLGSNYSYVFRHPVDSVLYFSCMDEDKHRLGLFAHVPGRRPYNKKVDFRGWFRSICHPTLSPDGKMLVFSSQGKVGLGGADLWCSFWNGKRWTKPINMGGAINTANHEVDPVFYGRYLIYASSESLDSNAVYHLYAVRIPDQTTQENIIFDKFQVQRLPNPINSQGSDRSMSVDMAKGLGYWVSTRNGKTELYCFEGSLEGVMLAGTVADIKGNGVGDASVQVLKQGRVVASATTDSIGHYQLVIAPGDSYRLHVARSNYFNYDRPLSALRTDDGQLVSFVGKDIVLENLCFNRTMVFDHVYRQGGEAELSAEGANSLAPIVNFLRDNPQVRLQLTLFCNETTDSNFNNMLIEQRISNLRQYLSSTLPAIDQISFKNGNKEGENDMPETSGNAIFAIIFPSDN